MTQIVVNYVMKFFSVTVVGCLQPVNWESCRHIDQWLLPDIQTGFEILKNPDIPYQNEKKYLESLLNSTVNSHVTSND
tara:strand:+ start:1142 stop:1375 length:234 start_codon:yes stop_codon:yes gene_type:complete